MKKIIHICVGTVAVLCLLGIGKHATPTEESTGTALTETSAPVEAIAPAETLSVFSGLPFQIPGTPLVLQALGEYEGPFLEDGTDEEMQGVCAIVENKSDLFIEYAEILVLQSGQELVFEVTYLPGNSCVLVIEKSKALYSPADVDSCRCENLKYVQKPFYDRRVYVSDDGDCSMIITNLTDTPVENVQIYYKQYFPDSCLYYGGITYCADIVTLLPGESKRITPYHFLAEQGMIVAIKAA